MEDLSNNNNNIEECPPPPYYYNDLDYLTIKPPSLDSTDESFVPFNTIYNGALPKFRPKTIINESLSIVFKTEFKK
jgi:hypothetical protein